MEPRVLVVDDDAVVGKSFDRVLSEKGFRVDVAMSGKEAFEKFDGKDFDLVFTDLRMPGQDGLEFAKRIREMNPWLPVVVVPVTGPWKRKSGPRSSGSPASCTSRSPRGSSRSRDAHHAQPLRRTTAAPAETAETAAAVEPKENVAKNVALFFAAPFIGLAYMLAFPFIGTWMIGRWGRAPGPRSE